MAYGQNIQCGRHEHPLRSGGEYRDSRARSTRLPNEFGWQVL